MTKKDEMKIKEEWIKNQFYKIHFLDIHSIFRKQYIDATQGMGAFPDIPKNIEDAVKVLSKFNRENFSIKIEEIKVIQVSHYSMFKQPPKQSPADLGEEKKPADGKQPKKP